MQLSKVLQKLYQSLLRVMSKQSILIVIGTAHRNREPGKQSPDGRLRECVYSREICKAVAKKLQSYGYKVVIDFESLDLPKNMQTPSYDLERSRELGMRVNIVNEYCRQNGENNVLYVSIHVDACGKGDKWYDANGWSVRVSPKASSRSKLLADCLFDAAKVKGLVTRKPAVTQKYWEQSLKVLNDTKCPAVLTENLFQDNKKDVDFLLSDKGKDIIVKLHVEGIINYIERI